MSDDSSRNAGAGAQREAHMLFDRQRPLLTTYLGGSRIGLSGGRGTSNSCNQYIIGRIPMSYSYNLQVKS